MSPSRPPPNFSDITRICDRASAALIDLDPPRMQAAREAMIRVRDRMAIDGAEPEALARLCRHIREIDAHLRRGSKARLKLVSNDIK